MSPVMVRPVREQLEHDRVIRLLQSRFRRRFEVGANPGQEQNAAVGSGASTVYPDLVLTTPQGGRRLHAVLEVETAESVNHLEALSQWARLARLRTPFHLYVPVSAVDPARRLCSEYHIKASEVVSYQIAGDQVRFTTVYRAPAASRPRRGTSRPAAARKTARVQKKAAPAKKRAATKTARAKNKKKTTAPAKKVKSARRTVKSVRKPVRAARRK